MLTDMRPQVEDVRTVFSAADEMLTGYLSENALARDLETARKWSITSEQLALVWWELYGPTERGKWKERLTLANAWSLSNSTSEDSLRRMVTRLIKTVTAPRLPPWIAP